MELLIILFYLGVLVVPFIITAKICKERNRDVVKGMVVTFFFGWIAVLILWLALKTRRKDGILV